MLRVIRNHRRAAYGLPPATRACRSRRCPSTPPTAPTRRWSKAARTAWDRALATGRGARLSQRPGHRDRPHRHHRPGDGLRHHRHRARFRPGQVQEAGRRRLFQDHQPHGARGPATRLGYTHGQIEEIIRYAVGHGTLDGAPGINHAALRAKGFDDEALARVEAALDSAFDIRFVFNKYTLGEDFCTAGLGIPAARLDDRRASTCWPIWASRKAEIDAGQHLLRRRHDPGRRPAPQARASARCSTAPARAARSAPARCRWKATSA